MAAYPLIYPPFLLQIYVFILLKADLSEAISYGRNVSHFTIFIMAGVYKDTES